MKGGEGRLMMLFLVEVEARKWPVHMPPEVPSSWLSPNLNHMSPRKSNLPASE